jgi:hypothetical protein
MSDWDKLAKAFDFIEAVIPYLDEMASRGDYQARTLHEQATAIEEEQDQ